MSPPQEELKKPEASQADGTLKATLQHIINKSDQLPKKTFFEALKIYWFIYFHLTLLIFFMGICLWEHWDRGRGRVSQVS